MGKRRPLGDRDAEALPVADASLAETLSVFGMFAADHRQTAAEVIRVTEPGGTIALASWRPDGFLGGLFQTIAAHVPPPAGLASPMLGGTDDRLAEIFGDGVTWAHQEQTLTFRFTSAEALVDRFATYYGPTLKALDAAGTARESLLEDLQELALSWNRLGQPGPIAVPGTYLESVGLRS